MKVEKKDIELIMLVANIAYLFIFIWDMQDGITVKGLDESTQENVNIHFTDVEEFKKWANEYLNTRDKRKVY